MAMNPQRRKLAPNDILYREGDTPNSFFVVLSGIISLYSERDGRTIERARLSTNAIVGDLAYHNPQPRTSSARAIVDSEVVEFPYDQITIDLKQLPGWAQLMMKTLGEQTTALTRELKQVQGESSGKLLIDDVLRGSATLRLVFETVKPENGAWDWEKVREYAVQVYQFPVLKLEPIAMAFIKAAWLQGRTEKGSLLQITEPKKERIREFDEFVRYYRHSRSKRAVIEATPTDMIAITALIETAGGQADSYRGAAKVFLPDALVKAQSLSGESGFRVDQFDLLIKRGLDIVTQSTENGLYVSFNLAEFESIRDNWRVLLSLP